MHQRIMDRTIYEFIDRVTYFALTCGLLCFLSYLHCLADQLLGALAIVELLLKQHRVTVRYPQEKHKMTYGTHRPNRFYEYFTLRNTFLHHLRSNIISSWVTHNAARALACASNRLESRNPALPKPPPRAITRRNHSEIPFELPGSHRRGSWRASKGAPGFIHRAPPKHRSKMRASEVN